MSRLASTGPLPGALAALMAAALTRPLAAQCPDGTPPPCRAAAAPPRAGSAPRLDPRTWIVLPFANVTREPDVEWLRDASVNLLYLHLSRWQDIRVIDDGRVADLLRTLPESQRSSLALNSGLALARRAGAGRLVMGDLFNAGSRMTVVAKVYDVSSGQRLRSVQEIIATRDSTMPAYERLAGRVLDATLPAGVSRDAVGTRSLDAYQEYVAGLRALLNWQLDSAHRRFERAIAMDTTFALAQYRLSITIGWESGFDSLISRHAEAAARFSAGLPARERGLIRGQQQFATERYAEACDTFRGLTASDANDVEAWYQLGECSFHGGRLEPASPDSSAARSTRDFTTAYRAFRRTLDLDPAQHLAYEHLLDMMRWGTGRWCYPNTRCQRLFDVFPVLRGDSIEWVVEPSRGRRGEPPNPLAEVARQERLRVGQELAQRWLAAAPEEAEAHWQYALVLNLMHRYGDAVSEVAAARRLGHRYSPVDFQLDMLFAADSSGRRTIRAAAELADSLLRGAVALGRRTGMSDADFEWYRTVTGAVTAGTFGAFSRIPTRGVKPNPSSRWPLPEGLVRALAQLSAGIAPANLAAVLGALRDSTVPTQMAAVVRLAMRVYCVSVCATSFGSADSAWSATALGMLERGDTAAARGALTRHDSTLDRSELIWGTSQIWAHDVFVSVLTHLALGDTAASLARLGQLERVRMDEGITFTAGGPPAAWVSGRAWLLTADLLRATGRADDANLYYRRVVDLWSGGDPEVQPFVQRARAQLPEWMR